MRKQSAKRYGIPLEKVKRTNKMTNELTNMMINFIQKQKEVYEKKGYIPTLELLLGDLKKSADTDHDCEIEARQPDPSCDHWSHKDQPEYHDE